MTGYGSTPSPTCRRTTTIPTCRIPFKTPLTKSCWVTYPTPGSSCAPCLAFAWLLHRRRGDRVHPFQVHPLQASLRRLKHLRSCRPHRRSLHYHRSSALQSSRPRPAEYLARHSCQVHHSGKRLRSVLCRYPIPAGPTSLQTLTFMVQSHRHGNPQVPR